MNDVTNYMIENPQLAGFCAIVIFFFGAVILYLWQEYKN